MVRRTLADVRPTLALVAGACGLNPSDARVLRYVNSGIEELLNENDWPSAVDRLRFKITGCKITVPSCYDRILYLTLDHTPMQMQSPWYEFVGVGQEPFIGNVPIATDYDLSGLTLYRGVLDRDEVATFNDVPTDNDYYPRVYGTVNEKVDGVRPKIIIQGYDNDKNWIRTQDGSGNWIDGVELEINGDTSPFWTQSTISISEVTAIIKPQTNGQVNLYAATQDGQTLSFLAGYAPLDTRPSYRRYVIPGLSRSTEYCVTARLRRRYVPLVNDNDWCLITNIAALKAITMAQWYMECGALDNYAAYKSNAIDLLKKEMTAWLGKQRQKPLFTFSEGGGVLNQGLYIQ